MPLIGRLIERKREGESLTRTEWGSLISDYTSGAIPEYQMAALLMASFLNGLSSEELSALTDAMIESGEKLAFEEGFVAIDKHSIGGVGDKVSIVLAPLVACCGVPVPMMSGRGLGHTTGTLDKLEAIPGFRTELTLNEARKQVEAIGCAMFGQTEEIAPADRKLYALRDATATVESIPLIAASIMSKKLCEGIAGLVLDTKHGSGAFLPGQEQAMVCANGSRSVVKFGPNIDRANLAKGDEVLLCKTRNAILERSGAGAPPRPASPPRNGPRRAPGWRDPC
ncbi:MAG: thymidine phosphorylase [Gemmatimonadetes bacterium]|nr:thymidine phosphorylase [Gemmatimonadota bacterium]